MNLSHQHWLRRTAAVLLVFATALIVIGTAAVCGALVYPELMPRLVAESTFRFRWSVFVRRGWTLANGMKIFADPADQVIAPQLVEFGVWEPGLTALVRKRVRPGGTFVDVGANVGYYTLLAAKLVGPAGRVIAFEPVPAEFELMRRGVEANGFHSGVYLEQKALSNKQGRLELYLSAANRGANSVVETSGEAHVSVPAITLDEYLGAGSPVDFIKMDIEGGEGFALEGMQQTLRSNRTIELAMEFSPWSLEHAGYSPEHLLDLLADDGFVMHIINEETGVLIRVPPEALLRTYAKSGNDPQLHWDLWLTRHPAASDDRVER